MIYIKYFAKYREWMGVAGHEVAADGVMLSFLLRQNLENHANFMKIMEDPRRIVAVNHRVVQGDVLLKDGDEVAIFPPVTGG